MPARVPNWTGAAGPRPRPLAGRDYVIPEDVKALAVPAMAHRISLRPEMWVRQVRTADVVEELLRRIPVPRARGVT